MLALSLLLPAPHVPRNPSSAPSADPSATPVGRARVPTRAVRHPRLPRRALFFEVRALVTTEAMATALEPELDQLVADWEAEGAATERIVLPPNSKAPALRAELQALYAKHSHKFTGALLVGPVPFAMFEHLRTGRVEVVQTFPTDHYFRDLDGQWLDTAAFVNPGRGAVPTVLEPGQDGLFDEFLPGSGDRAPEIQVGRLMPAAAFGDPVVQLRRYFTKLHTFRSGANDDTQSEAMMYLSELPDFIPGKFEKDHLAKLYGTTDLVAPDTHALTSALYFGHLDDDYEWVTTWIHGTKTQQKIDGSSWTPSAVVGSQLQGSTADFYMLNNCSIGRFAELDLVSKALEATDDYVGGRYIFSDEDHGLLVITRTKGGAMFEGAELFYDQIWYGRTVGEAARLRLERSLAGDPVDVSLRNEISEVVFGDPFLRPRHLLPTTLSDLSVNVLNVRAKDQIVVAVPEIHVSVRNGKNAVSGPISVRLYHDPSGAAGPSLVHTWTVPDLLPGVVVALDPVLLPATADGSVEVVIDEANAIDEADEGNNRRTASL